MGSDQSLFLTSDEAQSIEAVHALELDEISKTKTALCKLSCGDDAEGAIELLEDLVGNGNGEAEWILGLCYEYGIGTEQDAEHAVSLYHQSREAGNVVGKFLLTNEEGGRGTGVMTVKCL